MEYEIAVEVPTQPDRVLHSYRKLGQLRDRARRPVRDWQRGPSGQKALEIPEEES